ncbi:hypothetical protein GTA08_BOTSDO01271 [Botryosphaeria dothidea]|uniref:Uncharacterized protein n=1 Tax=Botryosphaeria dothidea TaxID=55169 RepID=A0A8H4J9F9_9PEZI|nr:hypothetical protein GTA08_BOTSDO01271 [Botryosphaeria dothidea]
MDDWGDPWQDDAGPKHPPAIDIRILADEPRKERVVTPVVTGFFEDQAKWSEPTDDDVWAQPTTGPSPPLRPAKAAEDPSWDVPSLEPADAADPADAPEQAEPAEPYTTVEHEAPQPSEEARSDPPVESPSHEATPSSDAPEESGVPPATPTAPEIDSSDSGTTVGPDVAGYTAIVTSAPSASRPHSEEFESGISTRPSTSPSELSHGDVFSDSTRTSFDEDAEPSSASTNGETDQHKEETVAVEDAEDKESEAESRTATPHPLVEEFTETPNEAPVGKTEPPGETITEDKSEEVSEDISEDTTEIKPEGTAEDAFDDDDFDDFGDFEEEEEEEEPDLHEQSANEASSPVESSPSSPVDERASALDLNDSAPNSPRPFVKADFSPELSLIGQLFPDKTTEKKLPEVEDSPIKPTNARKSWYRLTRVETLHELTSGKSHDSYVRVGWQGSTIRTEVNQIVGRWTSEDRINGRTLLGGKPGAMFGWDYPMPSPASSMFSVNSHKRNASAAPTPKKAAFDVEETKQRPMSLTVPPPRKPSISSTIDIPQFSWSSTDEASKEPATLSAPHSKTAFGSRPSSKSSNPWAAPFADKAPAQMTIMPISAPPIKTSFEEKIDSAAAKTSLEEQSDAWKPAEPALNEKDAWKPTRPSFEEPNAWKSEKSPVKQDNAWKPAEPSLDDADAWGLAKKSFEESGALQSGKKSSETIDAWKSSRKSEEADGWNSEEKSLEEADAWKSSRTSIEEAEAWKSAKESEQQEEPPQPPQKSLEDLSTTWEPVKNSQDKIIGWKPDKASVERIKNQRPPHTRTVSDSGILHGPSPFDNPFAPPEPEKPKPDEADQQPVEDKKKKKRLSWLTFPKRKKNDSAHKRSVSNASFLMASSGLSVPAKSESLPSWESPWARKASKSPLANEATLPDPEPEIARKEHESEIPLGKHEPNPWDNAFDNAWARPPTAKSGSSHNDFGAATSKPTLPTIDTAPRPPSPKVELSAPQSKLPAIETNFQPPKTEAPLPEEKTWGGMVESPMASPAIMTPDENPWGDPWKATSVEPAPVTVSVEPPSASKPTTKLAPLDTSVQPPNVDDDDDDDWGEMVESPAASSPVIAPPPPGQVGLPRSVSPINLPMSKTARTHPPSPLVPEPIRSATMPISPTTSGMTPPRTNPSKSSAWLPKPTPPRPLSPLNPARSSTLPVTQAASNATLASPWLQQPTTSQALSSATGTTSSDPWSAVDLSIFDKPAPSNDVSTNARNRTSSSPAFPSDSNPSATSSSNTPVITFDGILGGSATRTDRSSSTPITFDDILQPSRSGSGSATTFDDILARPGSLSPATSQTDLKAAAADQAQGRSPSPIAGGWTEQDKVAVKNFVAGLPNLGYMLR